MGSEGLWLLVALIAGMLLGFSYLGSLWFTIRRLPTATHPIILILSSFILRIMITTFFFYLIVSGHWIRLMFGLLGFLLIRTIGVYGWKVRNPKLALVKG